MPRAASRSGHGAVTALDVMTAREDFEMPRDMRHMPPGMRPTMH